MPQEHYNDKAPQVVPDNAYFQRIQIGATLIEAEQGTRYADGRLSFTGVEKNGVELQLKPAAGCQSPGVITEVMQFAPDDPAGFARFTSAIVRDSGGGDVVVVDSTSQNTRPVMPVHYVMGAKTYDVPGGGTRETTGHYILTMFGDGTTEVWLAAGERVDLQSIAEQALGRIAEATFRGAPGNPGDYNPDA